MSIMTSSTRRAGDHFEPTDTDPQVQRRMRGYLEQIDYTAFASNKAVLSVTVPRVEGEQFQRLAVAASTARARWVTEAVAMTDHGGGLVAAIGRDNFLGVQFHPEKSQAYGLDLLSRFLEWKP